MKFSLLSAFLCAAAVTLSLSGCLDVSAVDANWKVGSHVTDWRDEVVYQLLVDRFADGDLNNDVGIDPTGLGRYQGGDWQGVIDHLDYLQSLGVTAIWISPVVRNVDTDANFDGYHGYWAQSLDETNPHMGDLAKLRELSEKVHARGMKLVLDIVTNHMGQLFYYDINKNGVPDENVYGKGWDPVTNMPASNLTRITEYDPDWDPRGIQAYTSLGESGPAPLRWLYLPDIHRMPPSPPEFQNLDFYHGKGRIVDYTNSNHQPPPQVIEGDFPGGLKDLNTTNQDVRDALYKVYAAWIDNADFDAFRIDTLKHVEHEFWQDFCPRIRQHAKAIGKSNFLMFGEAFDGDDQLVASFTGNEQVDSAFFFPQKFAVIDRVIKYNQEGTQSIENEINTLKSTYPGTPNTDGVVGADGTPLTTQQLMVNFLDNHDIPRFLYDKPSVPALHNALGYIFTTVGIPCVYYGTEQQFHGGNDPSNRERLWDTNFDTTGPTFQWIRALSDVRKKFEPLRRGDITVRWSSQRIAMESDAGIFAFERSAGGKRALVVINTSDLKSSTTQAPSGGRMMVGFSPGTGLVNVLGNAEPAQVGADGTVAITVPQRNTVMNSDGTTTIEPGIRVFVDQADQGGINPIP